MNLPTFVPSRGLCGGGGAADGLASPQEGTGEMVHVLYSPASDSFSPGHTLALSRGSTPSMERWKGCFTTEARRTGGTRRGGVLYSPNSVASPLGGHAAG